jgi:cytidylate kinase
MGIIIAIDGPAGSGKSTTAKEVAKRLGFLYVDTGSMYRAVTLAAIRNKVTPSNEKEVVNIAKQSVIDFKLNAGEVSTFLNGEDVSEEIRSSKVSKFVSPISAIPGVREVLVEQQRKIGSKNDVVMEGRDIGTFVFPDADFKFYLDADIKERTKRRSKDYRRVGQSLELSEIERELRERDRIDSSRAYSPLKKANDAIVIDTTNLRFEDQVEKIIVYIKNENNIVNVK